MSWGQQARRKERHTWRGQEVRRSEKNRLSGDGGINRLSGKVKITGFQEREK